MTMDYYTSLLVILSVAAIKSVRASADPTSKECPLWTELKNGSCKCGSSAFGLVECDDERGALAVTNCYCMTAGRNGSIPLVGGCLYACEPFANSTRYLLKVNTTQDLDNATCRPYKRTGVLCGECIEGYGLPVYSYSLSCVECTLYKYNWLKYIAVAYVPLAIFCAVIIIFRVSATTGMMAGYIVICQMLSLRLNVVLDTKFPHKKASLTIISFFSIWNLDFFRSLYTPFCIHPELSALQVSLLDYAVALCPMILTILTYAAVKMHDRHSLVVWLCKPLTACFICFRKEWNIKNSLVQAMATFYVLSYVKVFNTSIDILAGVYLIGMNSRHEEAFAINPAFPYFGKDHFPYAIAALIIIFTFNILPLSLLCLYPSHSFHKCLNKTKCRWPALHIFMDAILGTYTHKPRERRYFGVIYMIIRGLHVLSSLLSPSAHLPAASYIMIAAIALVVIFQPYKNKWYNAIDVALFAALLNCYLMIIFIQEAGFSDPRTSKIQIPAYTISFYATLATILIFGIAASLSIILPQKAIKNFVTKTCRGIHHVRLEESLPHRMEREG